LARIIGEETTWEHRCVQGAIFSFQFVANFLQKALPEKKSKFIANNNFFFSKSLSPFYDWAGYETSFVSRLVPTTHKISPNNGLRRRQ